MKKERNITGLQHESLKKHPFGVPEGYFESFSERLQERIREDSASKVPVRRMITTARFRVAMAAAMLDVALISYAIIWSTAPNRGAEGNYFDIALLEQLQVTDDDIFLMELIESESEALNEEEAYVTQAIDYLAINDVEMDLIFE